MPRVKERSNIPNLTLEQRYSKALKGLEDGTYKSLASAAQANDLSKSSLGHQKNGRQPRREAHHEQQTFSPAAERAIVKWILKLDSFGLSPRVDILMGCVRVILYFYPATCGPKGHGSGGSCFYIPISLAPGPALFGASRGPRPSADGPGHPRMAWHP